MIDKTSMVFVPACQIEVPVDVRTVEGALAAVEHLQVMAKNEFFEKGTLYSVAFVLATCEPRSGQSFEKPVVVGLDISQFDSGTSSSMVHQIVQATKAIGVIMFHECWAVFGADRDSTKRVSEDPARKEVVYCTLEHRLLSSHGKAWSATIVRKNEKATMDNFRELPVEKTSGRMTGFLTYLS
jgi:hypothetical protein